MAAEGPTRVSIDSRGTQFLDADHSIGSIDSVENLFLDDEKPEEPTTPSIDSLESLFLDADHSIESIDSVENLFLGDEKPEEPTPTSIVSLESLFLDADYSIESIDSVENLFLDHEKPEKPSPASIDSLESLLSTVEEPEDHIPSAPDSLERLISAVENSHKEPGDLVLPPQSGAERWFSDAEEPEDPIPPAPDSLERLISAIENSHREPGDPVLPPQGTVDRRFSDAEEPEDPIPPAPDSLERLISAIENSHKEPGDPVLPPQGTVDRRFSDAEEPEDHIPPAPNSLERLVSLVEKPHMKPENPVPPPPSGLESPSPDVETPDTPAKIAALEESAQPFAPSWDGCSGVFNDGNGLSSVENERIHHHKHAVVGREWEREMPLAEYRARATAHLNSLEREKIVELCQVEDLAVVKYNLDTGEVGIVRRDDGLIKTFFRPNDAHYLLRKVDSGLWGEPAIADGFESSVQSSDFADDPQNFYLFSRLEELALELSHQAHEMVAAFAQTESTARDMVLLLARLGECRFIVFEFQRRILTEAQSDAVFLLRKKIVGAIASFEGLERYRPQELIASVKLSLENEIKKQEDWWAQAATLVTDLDDLEASLLERERVGFALLELRVLQLHQRMLGIDLLPFECRIQRSDINLRGVFYQLATRFNLREARRVSPEAFFWRRMAANIA